MHPNKEIPILVKKFLVLHFNTLKCAKKKKKNTRETLHETSLNLETKLEASLEKNSLKFIRTSLLSILIISNIDHFQYLLSGLSLMKMRSLF